MDFPQYRKYTGKNTYYKISSEKQFEEISFIGTKKFIVTIDAKQFPEMLRIQDMLICKDGAWEVIDSILYVEIAKLPDL